MKADAALVQSVFAFAIREINALEDRIVRTEDDADAMLWEQARQVVAQLDAGLSQRALAAQWINVRNDGKPYSVAHVNYTAKVYRVKFTEHPRPRFRDCYNALSNAASTRLAGYSGDVEWYSPREIIEPARLTLGAIDLDPASCPAANDVVKAARFFTREDDGLAQPWHGRVWMNPPYAHPAVDQFVDKLAASVADQDVSAAVVLVNSATDTKFFTRLSTMAAAICFPMTRVHFWKLTQDKDSPIHPQAVFYVGPDRARFRDCFEPLGPTWLR